MAVQGVTVTLSSGTPTAIAGAGGALGVLRVTVRNRGTGTAFLGSSSVTTAAYQLTTADSPLTITLNVGESLYGCSTGTPALDVLRVNDTTV